jgi:hypothetical protein
MQLDNVALAKAIVAQQRVRAERIGTAAAGGRNALRGLAYELLRHLDQPVVEALVAKVRSRPLSLCPFHGCADREINDGAKMREMIKRVQSGLTLIRTVNVPGFMRCV